MREGFVPRKKKIYPLSRKEREEIHKFITEQLRKGYMKKAGIKAVRREEWQSEGGLVLRKRKMYVPKDKELRVEII